MISYCFDTNIFSKIKLLMSQNVELYLQNNKNNGKKNISAHAVRYTAIFCITNRLVIICHKIDLQIIAMCAHFNKILQPFNSFFFFKFYCSIPYYTVLPLSQVLHRSDHI